MNRTHRNPVAKRPLSKALRPKLAAERIGVSVVTFFRWAREDPSFPDLFRPTSRTTLIDSGELDAWLEAKRGVRA